MRSHARSMSTTERLPHAAVGDDHDVDGALDQDPAEVVVGAQHGHGPLLQAEQGVVVEHPLRAESVLGVHEQVARQGPGHGAGTEQQRPLLQPLVAARRPEPGVGDAPAGQAQHAEHRGGAQPGRAGHPVAQAAQHHGTGSGGERASHDHGSVVEHRERQAGAVEVGAVEQRDDQDQHRERLESRRPGEQPSPRRRRWRPRRAAGAATSRAPLRRADCRAGGLGTAAGGRGIFAGCRGCGTIAQPGGAGPPTWMVMRGNGSSPPPGSARSCRDP